MFARIWIASLCFFLVSSSIQAEPFRLQSLPLPGAMVSPSVPAIPVALKGLKINPAKPLELRFMVDTGDQSSNAITDDANRLVRYFLTALTVPDKDLWVNLSPFERERMVPEALGQTELGRDLLAQDYLLKQLTASLIFPQSALGKQFWSQVYSQSKQKFGHTTVAVDSYHKVWIVPAQAEVYEKGGSIFITEAKLKALTEQDYLALAKNGQADGQSQGTYATSLLRSLIIPEIEREINAGKNFAPLRQIFQALILAKWYKETVQNQIMDAVFTDRNQTDGLKAEAQLKQQIYERYVEAYKKGVFNFIKEDTRGPRKYFSGGTSFVNYAMVRSTQEKAVALKGKGFLLDVAVDSSDTRQDRFKSPYFATAAGFSDARRLRGQINQAMSSDVAWVLMAAGVTLMVFGPAIYHNWKLTRAFSDGRRIRKFVALDPGEYRDAQKEYLKLHMSYYALSEIYEEMGKTNDLALLEDLGEIYEAILSEPKTGVLIDLYFDVAFHAYDPKVLAWAKQKLVGLQDGRVPQKLLGGLQRQLRQQNYPELLVTIRRFADLLLAYPASTTTQNGILELLQEFPMDELIDLYVKLKGPKSDLVLTTQDWFIANSVPGERKHLSLRQALRKFKVNGKPLFQAGMERIARGKGFKLVWSRFDIADAQGNSLGRPLLRFQSVDISSKDVASAVFIKRIGKERGNWAMLSPLTKFKLWAQSLAEGGWMRFQVFFMEREMKKSAEKRYMLEGLPPEQRLDYYRKVISANKDIGDVREAIMGMKEFPQDDFYIHELYRKDPEGVYAEAAIFTLGQMKSVRGLDSLIQLGLSGKDKQGTLLPVLITSIGAIGSPRGLAPLLALYEVIKDVAAAQRTSQYHHNKISSLTGLIADSISEIVQQNKEPSNVLALENVMTNAELRHRDLIEQLLASPNPIVRRTAIAGLGRLPILPQEYVTILIRVLKESAPASLTNMFGTHREFWKQKELAGAPEPGLPFYNWKKATTQEVHQEMRREFLQAIENRFGDGSQYLVDFSKGTADAASLSNDVTSRSANLKGGIDFNPLQVRARGQRIVMSFDPAQLQEIRRKFLGFTPVITAIHPVTSAWSILD